MPHSLRSIGLPISSTVITIRDDDGNVLPVRASGEICVEGPQVMRGYWNRPDETEKVMIDGRILRTGDIGYMDEDGYVFIVDRIKDMINASGFKVYPRRIEDALYEHPAVAEVTAGGVDTAELSSKTMAAAKVPGLFFTGEVVDVTGELGGYNLHWAFASGFAAGQAA